MNRRHAIVSLPFLFGLFVPRPALAHDELVSSSVVEVEGREVSWRVDVGIAGLAKLVNLPLIPSEADLLRLQPRIAAALARDLAVRANGVELAATPAGLTPIAEPGIDGTASRPTRVEQRFTFTSAAPVTKLALRVAFFSALTTRHRAVVRVAWNGGVRTFAPLGPGEISLAPEDMVVSSGAVVREFVPWGLSHIFRGYDHLAFLLALLLGVTRLREAIVLASSFTAAHSLTLALSTAEVVRIPSRVSEALIAASIVYVAVENLGWLALTARHRWLVTFVFGLVHGLGFATELRTGLAEAGGRLLLPVLSFNLGVELGQVAIVAVAWPVLAWLRRGVDARDSAARQRRLLRMGSVPILLVGLYWLAERILG